MGQQEVYAWLQKRLLYNDEEYYSIREVKEGLVTEGHSTGTNLVSVSRALHCLRRQGVVIMRMRGNGEWLREFRCKK